MVGEIRTCSVQEPRKVSICRWRLRLKHPWIRRSTKEIHHRRLVGLRSWEAWWIYPGRFSGKRRDGCFFWDIYRKMTFWEFISHRIHGTGIFTYIYHRFMPNVGKYTIHGSYGYRKWFFVSISVNVEKWTPLTQFRWYFSTFGMIFCVLLLQKMVLKNLSHMQRVPWTSESGRVENKSL